MGTFAEAANVDYLLSFDKQGKQTSDFRFICSKQTEVDVFHQFRFRIYTYLETTAYIYIYISINSIYIYIYSYI
jgi:hypothetical protein